MSRCLKEYKISLPADALMHNISQYLSSEGYQYTNYHNENVYKKGKGIATGPTFVKLSLLNDILRIEAWVKFAVVPGVYAGEMNLEGVAGIAIKKPLKGRITYIESLILSVPGNQLINFNPEYYPELVDANCNQPPVQPQPQYNSQPQYTQYPPVQPQQPQYTPQPQQSQFVPPAPEPKVLKCIRCGKVLPDGAAFCSACGYPVRR